MKTTTILTLVCAAALAGCDGDPLGWDPDGQWYGCDNDFYACIADDQLEDYPGIIDVVCDYCDDHGFTVGCTIEDTAPNECKAPSWESVVDLNGAAINGWECVVHGGVIFTLLDGSTSGPNPIRLQDVYDEDQGFWGVCAGGQSDADASCAETCTDRVAAILEGVNGEDYQSASFWIISGEDWLPYTGTLTPELFCDEAFAAAYTSSSQACPAGLVLDPTMGTFVWSDDTKAPLACNLNVDCCEDVGVCDFTTGLSDRSIAANIGVVTGSLAVDHLLGSDSAPITGEVRWTAPDCQNPGGSCPIYLEAVDLAVTDLAGGDRVDNYLLRGLGLSLASPTMGAWRADTGEVQFMSEVVQFHLSTDESESSDGTVKGTQDLTQRPDGTLYGTLTDGLLTLHATRDVNGVQVSVQVDARSAQP